MRRFLRIHLLVVLALGVAAAAPRPLTSYELLLKLYHGSLQDAKTAVKARGVRFQLTPQLEKHIVDAGGDKALLSLCTLLRS